MKKFYEIGSYNGIKDLENLLKNETIDLFNEINKTVKNIDKKILQTIKLLENKE